LAVTLVPLLLFAPGGAASAAPVAPSQQVMSQEAVGVVPNVVGMSASDPAVDDTIRAAGFVVATAPGWADCGSPYVQDQSPAGGTSAPLGSTVVLYISQWPVWPNPCP
jgi:beta-lactam-binding protein with PASTA domain